MARPSRRPARLPLPRKSTKAQKKVGGGGGGGSAPAPSIPGHRPPPSPPCAPRPRAGIVLEIAASLEVKPYLRVNPRRTLSPAPRTRRLHRGCIYLPAGRGARGAGRGRSPGCRYLTTVGTRMGTASHRGKRRVLRRRGDPLALQSCSAQSPPPNPAPPTPPQHPLPGACGRAKCPFAPHGSWASRHHLCLAWKRNRLPSWEQVQVLVRRVRGSRGRTAAGPGCPGPPARRPHVQHLPAEQQERAVGRGCVLAPWGGGSTPGGVPRRRALRGEEVMILPSSSIRHLPFQLTLLPVFEN